MTNPKCRITIDASNAFRRAGLDPATSELAERAIPILEQRLADCLTPTIVLECMLAASKQRARKPASKTVSPQEETANSPKPRSPQ